MKTIRYGEVRRGQRVRKESGRAIGAGYVGEWESLELNEALCAVDNTSYSTFKRSLKFYYSSA